MTAGPPGRGEGWPLGRPRPRSAVPGIPAGFSTEDHVLTAEQHIEDVRRHIAARIDQYRGRACESPAQATTRPAHSDVRGLVLLQSSVLLLHRRARDPLDAGSERVCARRAFGIGAQPLLTLLLRGLVSQYRDLHEGKAPGRIYCEPRHPRIVGTGERPIARPEAAGAGICIRRRTDRTEARAIIAFCPAAVTSQRKAGGKEWESNPPGTSDAPQRI